MREAIERLSVWIWFGFLLSLLPLVYNTWRLADQDSHMLFLDILKNVISHGELLLICISTIGAAIGELIRKETKWKIIKICLGGIALLVFFFAAMAFTDITFSQSITRDTIFVTSRNILIATMIISISAMLLPKSEHIEPRRIYVY